MASRPDAAQPVTHDSIAWEQIPEPTVCICGHPKAVHRYQDPSHNTVACSTSTSMSADSKLGKITVRGTGCRCIGFHDIDHPMPWTTFAGRFLETDGIRTKIIEAHYTAPYDTPVLRRRAALTWAWKQSGLPYDTHPRTWAMWIADSKRVWRAWRASGSPIVAFGKETSFGPAEIAALEDR